MTTLNLKEEIAILEMNYHNQLKLYGNVISSEKSKKTFREDNWLLTFPFNFFKNDSLELIRKLAVTNSFYVSYFLAEDDVIDDYNCSNGEFREIIKKFLRIHYLKNLAIGQFLDIFGQKIYKYIFNYEDKYYRALNFEKSFENISLNNMLDETNLLFLGNKLLPLGVAYAGYCFFQNEEEKIPFCEKLLICYHIAKQLYDDIVDLNEDIQKPDLSYLIKVCNISSSNDSLSVDSVKQTLIYNDYCEKYFNTIKKYLYHAENIAEKLNFNFFIKEIVAMQNKVNILQIKFKE